MPITPLLRGQEFDPETIRPMTDRTETCRTEARECERAALLATQADERVIYLILARQWREMAKLADEFDGNAGHRAAF